MPEVNTLDLRKSPRKKRSWRRIALRSTLVLGIMVVVAAAALIAWRLWFYKPNLDNVGVIKSLISRHYVLPQGEEPTLATITDATKLQTPFLKRAQNDDKLLVYEKAGVAIIYRPKIDRIIAVGPVSIQPVSDGN